MSLPARVLFLTVVVQTTLAHTAPAQTRSFTSPPALKVTEGNSSANALGQMSGLRAPARTQLLEADFQDNTIRVLRGLRLRHDNSTLSVGTISRGRTWSQVTMRIGRGQRGATTLDLTFARNANGAQTRVFRGKVQWPDYRNLRKPSKPAPWGGAKGNLSFPFNSLHLHVGTEPLLCEWDFLGGTANASSWSQTDRLPYFLDAELPTTLNRSESRLLKPAPPCSDQGQPSNRRATTAMRAIAFSQRYWEATWRGKVTLDVSGLHTTPNKDTVVHAVGVGLIQQGVAIGARCNRLHIDLAQPTLYVSHTAVAANYSGWYRWESQTYQAAFSSLQVVAQTAWRDSRSRQFSLSAPCVMTMPAKPFTSTAKRHMAVGQNRTTALFVTTQVPILNWETR